MAKDHAKPFSQIGECRSSPIGEPSHRGIKTQPPKLRRSTRLRDIYLVNENHEKSYPSPSTTGKDRKRKRQQEPEYELCSVPAEKKPRVSPIHYNEGSFGVEAANIVSKNQTNPIDHWRKHGSWPKEYLEMERNADHLLAHKKSSSSLLRKQLEASSAAQSSTMPSDQKPREEKSTPYQHPGYPLLLETKGSFMHEDEKGPKPESIYLCRKLLENVQDVPKTSRYSDEVFKSTCQRIQNRNEAKVIQDITRLIVPSAEELTGFGAEHLGCLIESVNEGWNNSIPLTKTRPQPDYSVGFKRTAFTKDQIDKLQPFGGDFLNGDRSYFMATFYMYFPFLTCEVKCGAAALDVADKQNAHSMTLAVRGLVEIFRCVKREKEVDQEILAFSISHDHRALRIYGHYPVIKGKDTMIYRYPIHEFSFTALDGKERWTAYKFTKNIYDVWAPNHFKRLCSVIDELRPNPDLDVSPLSEGPGLSGI